MRVLMCIRKLLQRYKVILKHLFIGLSCVMKQCLRGLHLYARIMSLRNVLSSKWMSAPEMLEAHLTYRHTVAYISTFSRLLQRKKQRLKARWKHLRAEERNQRLYADLLTSRWPRPPLQKQTLTLSMSFALCLKLTALSSHRPLPHLMDTTNHYWSFTGFNREYMNTSLPDLIWKTEGCDQLLEKIEKNSFLTDDRSLIVLKLIYL